MQTTFFRPIDLLKVRNLKVSYAEPHLFGLTGQAGAVEDAQDVQLKSASPNMQQLLVSIQAIGQFSDYNHHPTYRAFITFVQYDMGFAINYGFIPYCFRWDNS